MLHCAIISPTGIQPERMFMLMNKTIGAFIFTLILILSAGTSVLAVNENFEDEQITLTLEESIERVFGNSFQIRRAVTGSEKAYIVREKAMEDWDDMDPIIPTLEYLMSLNVIQKDLQWRMSQREIDLLKDRLGYDTTRLYLDIFREKAAVEYARQELERAEKNADRASILYRLGAASRLDYLRARSALENAAAELKSREQDLQGAYERLNRLLGLPLQERPLLVDVPDWEPLRDLGVNLYVARATENNIALWLAEQQIELARYDVKIHRQLDLEGEDTDPLRGPEPLEAKEKSISMAEDDYRDTRRQLEQNTRDIYRSIRSMEQEKEKLMSRLEELERELQAQQARFAAGLVTAYDFFELEAAREQFTIQETNLLIEHELLKQVIQKPWVLGAAAR